MIQHSLTSACIKFGVHAIHLLEDGPLSYYLEEGTEESKKEFLGLNTLEKRQHKFIKVTIPYAMKLFIHEMNGLGTPEDLNAFMQTKIFLK